MKLDFDGFDEKPDPKQEEKLARVASLLKDVREAKALEAEHAEIKRTMRALDENRKKRTGKDRHASVVTLIHEGKDGEYETLSVALNEPTEAMNALMDQKPVLLTNLVWAGLPMPLREDLLHLNGMDVSLAATADSFSVFPEASRHYCLAWQRMINTGEAWETSQTIGDTAQWMIAEGYCMLSPEGTDSLGFPQPGREDIPAGKPGTVAFMRAVMGEAYTAWLVRNEPPGDPVPLG